jgi:fatty acid desaturase
MISYSFLSKHKYKLEWLHFMVTIFLIFGSFAIFHSSKGVRVERDIFLFLLCIIGYCQNIGLMHTYSHHFVSKSRDVGILIARISHTIGGLSFTFGKQAHSLHHKYLGTELDPDRNGYNEFSNSVFKRLRYLLLIGPLRGIFAPVNIENILATWTKARRQKFFSIVKIERLAIVLFYASIVFVYRVDSLFLISSLICANFLSNIREVTEHGNQGKAAYVNIAPSAIGILFFSTPGFWFHGFHHIYANVHYLDLPLKCSGNCPEKIILRKSYLKFLLTGV